MCHMYYIYIYTHIHVTPSSPGSCDEPLNGEPRHIYNIYMFIRVYVYVYVIYIYIYIIHGIRPCMSWFRRKGKCS